MCLLITGKSNAIRHALLNTAGLLADIFASNADGLGAMFIDNTGRLMTPKIIPKKMKAIRNFLNALPDDDRNLALHWRMRTHGKIDLLNCHPYDVLPGQIAMMHNGVLRQGNKADPDKSDTWHYIQNVIRPQLEHSPKLFTITQWQALIEADIGDNRFAIMDQDGELVVLNKDDGIEHDGIWFSNTYAWDPALFIHGYTERKYSYGGWGNYRGYHDDFIYYGGNTEPLFDDEETEDSYTADDVWGALDDPEVMADLLFYNPRFTLKTLFADCEFQLDPTFCLTKTEELFADDLKNERVYTLTSRMKSTDEAELLANIIVNYGYWSGKAINKRTPSEKAQQELQDELDEINGAMQKNAAYAG